MSDAEIARLREDIAGVDGQILNLVARRLHLSEQLGLEKKLAGHPVRDSAQQDLVVTRFLTEGATHGITPPFLEGLARLLMDEGARRQEVARLPSSSGQRVLVVGGAGQMGRWLCRYFRSRGYAVAVNDPTGPSEDFPSEPDLTKGVLAADVVAVSVPMSSCAEVLRRIAGLKPKALIFDIASLKGPIERELRGMGRDGLRVASVHPVFGPDLWPLSSGNIIFSDCGNGLAVVEAKELFRATGASFVDVSLDHHDEFMAFLLGLTHLCLLTFARGVAQSPFDLAGLERSAGTTFSRLSVTAAEVLADSPALLRDLQALNPHTPYIHRLIRKVLDDWQAATTAPDEARFLELVAQARAYFQTGKEV